MNLENITSFIGDVGITGALLLYLVWRLDKFLTFLCGKLEIYNGELKDIAYALNGIIEELRKERVKN